ncbi:hypothetical protein K402DRAFT_300979, partial [Aulographum hederae CBS 113979]
EFLPIYLTVAILMGLLHLIHADYIAFLSLGPGGTPSTPLGYLRVKLLSLLALRNPYLPPPIPSCLNPQIGYFSLPNTSTNLPKRDGTRPIVRGIAPHRQSTQKSPLGTASYAQLTREIERLTDKPAHNLRMGKSCLEKHGRGLFTLSPSFPSSSHNCVAEVSHAHPSDGSLHLSLHPADAALVLERCWGERHPLARGGWFSRFVPGGFIMVYAPRTEEEVGTVMEILRAAVWWVGDVEV